MPTLSSMKPSSGVWMEKKPFGSSPLATRIIAMPARIIMPATMPPTKRYTGISQPHTCRIGSTPGLWRVVVISSMAVDPYVR